VTQGPAEDPLPFWALSIDPDGLIFVDSEDEVGSGTRVLPPPPDTAAS
jgi:hypothetical protein